MHTKNPETHCWSSEEHFLFGKKTSLFLSDGESIVFIEIVMHKIISASVCFINWPHSGLNKVTLQPPTCSHLQF